MNNSSITRAIAILLVVLLFAGIGLGAVGVISG